MFWFSGSHTKKELLALLSSFEEKLNNTTKLLEEVTRKLKELEK